MAEDPQPRKIPLIFYRLRPGVGNGLWEVRTDLPTRRTARVLLCLHEGHLVALHGFIKKTRATPEEDLALARKRQKELRR